MGRRRKSKRKCYKINKIYFITFFIKIYIYNIKINYSPKKISKNKIVKKQKNKSKKN
jgi:hypothetical protein